MTYITDRTRKAAASMLKQLKQELRFINHVIDNLEGLKQFTSKRRTS